SALSPPASFIAQNASAPSRCARNYYWCCRPANYTNTFAPAAELLWASGPRPAARSQSLSLCLGLPVPGNARCCAERAGDSVRKIIRIINRLTNFLRLNDHRRSPTRRIGGRKRGAATKAGNKEIRADLPEDFE